MPRRLDTQLVHAGEPLPRIAGAVITPIFQSATFELGDESSYHDIRYLRLSNSPSHVALHGKLAAIEGGEAALATASGMAAISTALLAVLRSGDHLIAQRSLYGGTHELITRDLAELGITTTFVDGDDAAQWAAAVRPSTRAFYCETLTNPRLELADLRGIAGFARAHGLISLVDNTFASPVNFRPLAHGFDVVLHSATKYLNGHSDIVAGAVVGSAELVARIKHKLDHFGGALDAHACFLLQRGLKTLGVRVRAQNASALAIARMLSEQDGVANVRYPGLPSHPQHDRARELLSGFGGMVAFEVEGGAPAAQRVISALELAIDAPSLGGAESLVTLPAKSSHVGLSAEQRAEIGISDGLVRLSVGLEDTADLIDDLRQALARV